MYVYIEFLILNAEMLENFVKLAKTCIHIAKYVNIGVLNIHTYYCFLYISALHSGCLKV